MPGYQELTKVPTLNSNSKSDMTILAAESSLTSCLRMGNQILKARLGDESGIIVVTGSLHIVSSVLSFVRGWCTFLAVSFGFLNQHQSWLPPLREYFGILAVPMLYGCI